MVIYLLAIITGILIAHGLFRITCAIFVLPSRKTRNAIQNLNGRLSFSKKIKKIITNLASLIEKFVSLTEYREKNLSTELKRLERSETPKQFLVGNLLKSITIALGGMIFWLFGAPWMAILCVLGGILFYFRSIQSLKEEVDKLNQQIAAEIPRMLDSLNISLQDSRDTVAFFEKYRKVAKPVLGRELDRLVLELKTGNHVIAYHNMDSRLRIPQVSQVVSILCGVYSGVDQRSSLVDLAQNLNKENEERLKRDANKLPRRIKTACLILTLLMIVMFMVPIAMLIMKNLQEAGFFN